MGKRSDAGTGIELLAAFLTQGEWRQRDLATKLELTERAVRAALVSMQSSGFPIQELPPPPTQRWRLRDGWLPEGVALTKREALETARYLARQPSSAERNGLIAKLLGNASFSWARTDETNVSAQTLRTLEDALQDRRPVAMIYRAASGENALHAKERVVSVAAFLHGARQRFIGIERGSSRPKVYRVDRIERAISDPTGHYRAVPEEQLRELIRTSIGGFHDGLAATTHVFWVRAPEANWVRDNLPVPASDVTVTEHEGGIRVALRAAASDVLARFVVGLGEAASVETDALRERVITLAEGALKQGEPPSRPGPKLAKVGADEGGGKRSGKVAARR